MHERKLTPAQANACVLLVGVFFSAFIFVPLLSS